VHTGLIDAKKKDEDSDDTKRLVKSDSTKNKCELKSGTRGG